MTLSFQEPSCYIKTGHVCLLQANVHAEVRSSTVWGAGVFLLKTFFYPEAEVVRTRDPLKLAECDIVLDVGGTYDPGEATSPLLSGLAHCQETGRENGFGLQLSRCIDWKETDSEKNEDCLTLPWWNLYGALEFSP